MCFAFYMLEAWSSMMILNMISKAFKKGDRFKQYSIYNPRTWEEKPGNWGLHGQSHLSSKAQASRVTWNPIFNKMSDKVMKLLRASPLERISTESWDHLKGSILTPPCPLSLIPPLRSPHMAHTPACCQLLRYGSAKVLNQSWHYTVGTLRAMSSEWLVRSWTICLLPNFALLLSLWSNHLYQVVDLCVHLPSNPWKLP